MDSSLLAVLSALIAAASVLAGAFLSHGLAARERKLERQLRDRKEAADFRLARGEELYVGLDRIGAYAARHASLIQLYCHGRLDLERFRTEREQALGMLDRPGLARIELTVLAFFQPLRPLHAELMANVDRLSILDEVLLAADPAKADLQLKLSKDSGRLIETVNTTSARLRDELVRDLAGLFGRSDRSGPA